jgi:hypothetical protein
VDVDVTFQDQVDAAVSAAGMRFGRIDVLVNNAGRGLLTAVEEASDAAARAIYDTSVFGTLNVLRAALPRMRAQRSGRIPPKRVLASAQLAAADVWRVTEPSCGDTHYILSMISFKCPGLMSGGGTDRFVVLRFTRCCLPHGGMVIGRSAGRGAHRVEEGERVTPAGLPPLTAVAKAMAV